MVIRLKKATLGLSIILCLLFVSFRTDYEISVKASPKTWTVPGDFNSIQKAINNVNSSDTIFVRIGTYYENVVINKSIALVGEDRDQTIIDGSGSENVILIKTISVSVKNFTIRRSGAQQPYSGIFVDRSRGNTIGNNKIIDNYRGISLVSSYSNVIYGNNVSANSDGIYLYSSSNNTFSDNIIHSNNYDGIYVDYFSSNNTFFRNVILSNPYDGISLFSSNYNVIVGNTISASDYGISFFIGSSNNTIYHNNFNNRVKQVLIESTQVWDYSAEGNYWSDYPGGDMNGDGIGDGPYVIDKNNQDNYPLMGNFSDFDVATERKTHHVSIVSNSTISDFRFQIGTETGNKIIHFKAIIKSGLNGFSRVTFPRELMGDPYIVLVDSWEVAPTLLNISDKAKVSLYFTYFNGNNTIYIISSQSLHFYSELLALYLEQQASLNNLNATYYELLANYAKLQIDLYNMNQTLNDSSTRYLELQASFFVLNETFYGLLANYARLQTDLYDLSVALNSSSILYWELNGNLQTLNQTYYGLLANYNKLLGNYSSLLGSLGAMNASYQQHLSDDSGQLQNFRSLLYIFAATTAIFIITTLYLSKLHAGTRRRTAEHILG